MSVLTPRGEFSRSGRTADPIALIASRIHSFSQIRQKFVSFLVRTTVQQRVRAGALELLVRLWHRHRITRAPVDHKSACLFGALSLSLCHCRVCRVTARESTTAPERRPTLPKNAGPEVLGSLAIRGFPPMSRRESPMANSQEYGRRRRFDDGFFAILRQVDSPFEAPT